MKRSVLIIVAAGVALVTSGAVYALRDREPGDGPVDAGSPGAYAQGLEVGDRYSAGQVVLEVTGDKPAVIERVRVVGIADGLEVLGIRTRLWPGTDGDPGTFIGAVGFPPEGYVTKPLSEQNVVPVATEFTEGGNPLAGLELAIGVRATRPGVARARGIEVTYRVGGTRYREEITAGIYLCAPAADYPGRKCPGDLMDKFGDGVWG